MAMASVVLTFGLVATIPVKHTGHKRRAAWPAFARRERKKRPATPVGMTE
jgi:hypothetical protein